jgi:tRNA A37 threonylcarbamoyladenosine synthetase subunit TsaC/SUA5/YrdC
MLSVISVEHNQSKLNKCFDGNIPSEAQHVFDSTQVFTSGIGYCYICQTQHAATSEVDILLLGNTSVGYRVPDDDAMRKLIETLNPAILFTCESVADMDDRSRSKRSFKKAGP